MTKLCEVCNENEAVAQLTLTNMDSEVAHDVALCGHWACAGHLIEFSKEEKDKQPLSIRGV